METTTTHALKEWAVAVDALEQGNMMLLLRKGGIREEGNQFKVAYDRILLYPTFEHQQPDLLKDEYSIAIEPVSSGWHPEIVRIGSWAEITDIFQVSDAETVTALLAYHIWNEKFVSDRLKWKPRQPIYILLLRTYKLDRVYEIPYRQEYGGCKSWIDLAETISIEGAMPVLDDITYNRYRREICMIVEHRSNV